MKTLTSESRRDFLKKTAYVVPTIVALGALTTPAEAMSGMPGGHSGAGGGSCIKPWSGHPLTGPNSSTIPE